MVGMPSLIFRCVPRHAMLVPTLLVASLLAGGCAPLDVPRAEVFPATGQKKTRAVHHWDVLADDVAAQIAQKIAAWPAGQHPIHVSGANESSFSQGFRKLLTVRLLDRGVPLSAAPAAVELVLDAQLVQHQTAGSMGLQLPGTVLSEGVSVARDVQLPAYGEMLDAPADKAAEVLHGTHDSGFATQPIRTEVLITTVLRSGDRYLAGSADVYYIDRADAGLYQAKEPLAPPPPPKSWKVVTP